MADEDKGYSSINALDAAAQKDALPYFGHIILDVVVTIVGFFILGQIINAIT